MVYVFMIKTLVILRCEPHRLHILGCASSVRAAQAFIFRCEPHRLLSFGASRTGFYLSVRAAQAFIFRYEPHRLLSFGASRIGFYPSLILRSSFAEGSLKVWGILNFKLGTSCKLAPAGVYFAI